MASKIILLKDLVPLEVLENILTSFSQATGLVTLVTDYQGRPITTIQRFNCFCRKVRKIPELDRLCIRSDASAGLESASRERPLVYQCYAGMVDVSVPIIIDGHYLGSIFTGQVLLHEEDMKKIGKLSVQFDVDMANYPEIAKNMEEYLVQHPRISLRQLQSYVALLHTIANYIADIGYKNLMQEELSQHRMRLLDEEKNTAIMKENIAKLELSITQSRINPSFLLNAFNSIHRQAVLENADKTSELILSLTSLLRRSTRQREAFTTIEDELNYIDNFITLKNVSTHSKIHLVKNTDPSCLDCYLPFFALQPLIENVFMHHFTGEGDYQLDIEIKRHLSFVTINVSNTNLYFEPRVLESILHMQRTVDSAVKVASLSLQNVVRILEQYYGDSFKWSMQSTQKSGTMIGLTIPYTPTNASSEYLPFSSAL